MTDWENAPRLGRRRDSGLTASNPGPASQTSCTWGNAARGSRALFDAGYPPPGFMHHIVAQGRNARLSITSGTSRSTQIEGVSLPARIVVSGAITIVAEKLNNDSPGFVSASIGLVSGSGGSLIRSLQSTPATLPLTARRLVALGGPAVIFMGGVNTSVAESQAMDVYESAILVSGVVLLEHEL